MIKISYIFIVLLLFSFILTGCGQVNKERIGAEYEVIIGDDDYGSHGSVKGYERESQSLVEVVKFDNMNSTQFISFNIVPDDTLEVSNKVESGEVWVKITQGDISKSEIQKVHIPNNDSQTINLNQWNSGEISIWLVVKEGTNGEIKIKHNS